MASYNPDTLIEELFKGQTVSPSNVAQTTPGFISQDQLTANLAGRTITKPTVSKASVASLINPQTTQSGGQTTTTSNTNYGPSNAAAAFNAGVGQTTPNSVASIGATTGNTQSNTTAVPGSVGSIAQGTGSNIQNELDAYYAAQKATMNAPVDENSIYQEELARRQAQINSINSMYADRINQARIQGQGRIESRQFAQGRSGQIGSGVGEAGINSQVQANTEQQNAIDNERQLAISEVYAKVSSDAKERAAAKTLAKSKSAEEYVSYLKTSREEQKNAGARAIASLVAKGVDIADMSPEQLKTYKEQLGMNDSELAAEFNTQKGIKAKADKESMKLDAEIANKQADTKKVMADIAQIGKITPYQQGQLDIERAKMNKAPVTEQSTKRDAVNAMSATVLKAAEEDKNGWLTPNQYKNLKQQWVSQTGYEPESFDAYFSDRAYTKTQDESSPYTDINYGIGGAATKKKTGELPVKE